MPFAFPLSYSCSQRLKFKLHDLYMSFRSVKAPEICVNLASPRYPNRECRAIFWLQMITNHSAHLLSLGWLVGYISSCNWCACEDISIFCAWLQIWGSWCLVKCVSQLYSEPFSVCSGPEAGDVTVPPPQHSCPDLRSHPATPPCTKNCSI